MAKSEQFNASVNFGGSIDSSLGRSLKWLTSNIQDSEKVTLKTMGVQTKWMKELQEGSTTTTSKLNLMGKSMAALTARQATLEKKIRAGVRAGEDVSKLTAEYKTVAVGISRAEKELEKLNAERKKEQEIEAKAQRSARHRELRHAPTNAFFERFSREKLADGFHRRLGHAPGALLHGAGSAIKWGAVGAAGAAVGLPGMIIAANKKLAEEASVAKSYGLSYEKYKAGSILAEQAGLNGENFGDLAEELSNKVGEQGNDKTLNLMLGQIGTVKSRLLAMSKSQQFDTVMQAITSRVKSGKMTATQGESLADQLMGGEANKLATYIIGLNQTYDEVMKSSARLNNTTNAEAEGAIEASRTLSNIWTAGETALMGMAGEVGKAMEPQLKSLEDSALTWIKENKEAIAKSIGDWATGGGPKRLVDGLELFGDEVIAVGQKLKWLLPDQNKVTKDQDTIRNYLAMGNPIEGGKQLAREYGQEGWFSEQHYDDPLVVDQLRQNWKEHHTPVDIGIDGPERAAGAKSGPVVPTSVTHSPTFNFSVNLAPGTSVDMAQDLYEQAQKLLGGAGFSPTVDFQ